MDSVDPGADFHQRGQIAGHYIQRLFNPELDSGITDRLFMKLYVAGGRSCLALLHQEEELRISQPHSITMLERAGLYRNTVYKRSVETTQIGEDERVSV